VSLQAELKRKYPSIKIQVLCPGLTVTDFFNTKEFGFDTFDEEEEFNVQSAAVVEESLAALTKEEVVFILGLRNRKIHSLMVGKGKFWGEAEEIVFIQESKTRKK
jgi:short-subunit dehydrogenase